jgi:hypothetical protein
MSNDTSTIAYQTFTRQNVKAILRVVLHTLIFCSILAALPGMTVNAQGESPWMPDQRIPGYLDDTFTPFLLADQNGNVHAFASQSLEAGGTTGIVYRSWNLERGWTTPVDILLAPYGNAIMQGAFLDSEGVLHLVFFGGDGTATSIYYSYAPLESADSIQAWATPIIIGDDAIAPPYAVLTGDGAGNLVMIYTGKIDGGGVYSAHSSDSGLTWSRPAPVYLVDNQELIPFSLRLYQGSDRQVHAVWSVVTSLGVDISLHYAKFKLETSEWTSAIVLNKRLQGQEDFFGPSFPSLVDNGSELIVMYNNGSPLPTHRAGLGRPVQMVSVSNDNGDTWEPPTVPFIKHEGRSGEHILVQDSDHVVHALFVQRTAGDAEILGGIWHSEYQNGYWSDPSRFIPTYDAHDLRAVVSQGNILLLVWRADPGVGVHGIWFTYKILDSKALPIESYPTRHVEVVGPTDPTALPVLSATRPPLPAELMDQPLIGLTNPGSSFGFGVIIVSLILVVILIIFGISRNRQL